MLQYKGGLHLDGIVGSLGATPTGPKHESLGLRFAQQPSRLKNRSSFHMGLRQVCQRKVERAAAICPLPAPSHSRFHAPVQFDDLALSEPGQLRGQHR